MTGLEGEWDRLAEWARLLEEWRRGRGWRPCPVCGRDGKPAPARDGIHYSHRGPHLLGDTLCWTPEPGKERPRMRQTTMVRLREDDAVQPGTTVCLASEAPAGLRGTVVTPTPQEAAEARGHLGEDKLGVSVLVEWPDRRRGWHRRAHLAAVQR